MSSGLRIIATGGMQGIGAIPKVRYSDNMIGTIPRGNTYSFWALRLVDPTLGPFLSLFGGVGHYRCC